MVFAKLGNWLVDHRSLVLTLLVLASVGSALLLPKLQFDFRMEAMIDFSAEEKEYSEVFRERFNTQEDVLLILLDGPESEVYSTDGLSLIFDLTQELETYDGIDGTFSLTRVPTRSLGGGLQTLFLGDAPAPLVESSPVDAETVETVRAQVSESRLIEGNLISEDGSTAAIVVDLADGYDDPDKLDPLVAELEHDVPDIVAASNANFDVHFGGLPYVRMATIRSLKSEQLIMWPVVGLAYFLLFLFVYRKLFVSVMPLVAVGLATLWTVGIAALAGVAVNMINNTLPTMVLVVGVCNAVHVMSRIFEERRKGLVGTDAIRAAVTGIGLASLLTTLTTAIGFASLVVARSKLLQEFGLMMATGVMLTYVAIIVALPVFASFVELNVRQANPAHRRGTSVADWLEKRSTAVMRVAAPVMVGAVVALAGCLWIGTTVPVDSRVIEVFYDGHPVVESNKIIETELGGILPLEVNLSAEPGAFTQAEPLQRVAAFEAEVRELDGVLQVMSLIDLLQETGMSDETGPPSDSAVAGGLSLLRQFQPEAIKSFATEDMAHLRVSVRLPDSGIMSNLATIEEINALADKHLTTAPADQTAAPPVEIEHRVTGAAYLSAVGLDTFVRDLFVSLLTATAIIFLVLTLVFRSLMVGLLSLLPNLLPLAITFAVIPIYGYELNTTTVVVFCIGIGLAVDNCIHMMARFRQETAKGRTVDEAIRVTMRTAAIAIVTSNLLLVGGLLVLLISDFDPIRRTSILTSTTIAAALFTSLVLLPAELKLWGHRIALPPETPPADPEPAVNAVPQPEAETPPEIDEAATA